MHLVSISTLNLPSPVHSAGKSRAALTLSGRRSPREVDPDSRTERLSPDSPQDLLSICVRAYIVSSALIPSSLLAGNISPSQRQKPREGHPCISAATAADGNKTAKSLYQMYLKLQMKESRTQASSESPAFCVGTHWLKMLIFRLRVHQSLSGRTLTMSKLLGKQSRFKRVFLFKHFPLNKSTPRCQNENPSTSIQAFESSDHPMAKDLLTSIEKVLLHRAFLARKLKPIE